MIIIIKILGTFYLQVDSSPKTWDSKPTFLEEQSEGIAVKSQMSQIKSGYSLSRKSLVKKKGFLIFF